MRTYFPLLSAVILAIALTAGCQTTTTAAQDSERAGFVTMLGNDTLAVERFQRTDRGMRAEVVLRAPETTFGSYEIEFDDAGELARYEATVRSGAGDGEVIEHQVATPSGDTLVIETTQGRETRLTRVQRDGSFLPFVDMVHWPFELVLTRAAETGLESLEQPLFTSRGGITFTIGRNGDGRMTMQHPFRGTMDVVVDASGRLQRLDASRTTRALTVQRVPDVDIDAIGSRFAAEDAAGRSFGSLSGRASTEASVKGASVSVDYGQPAKRGREIWGGLVSWGDLWRTGANRATHFETDQTLRFGDVVVPAGTYTLFSIPEEDGGTLIINRETGQNGNSYDESQDLGRVPMEARVLDETVELFTIAVDETDDGGELKLQWDQTELVAPFTVAGDR